MILSEFENKLSLSPVFVQWKRQNILFCFYFSGKPMVVIWSSLGCAFQREVMLGFWFYFYFILFILYDTFIYLFSENEIKKHLVREKYRLVASPYWGSNLQTRCYLIEIEPATFWCLGWCSNQLSYLLRALVLLLYQCLVNKNYKTQYIEFKWQSLYMKSAVTIWQFHCPTSSYDT